MPWKERGLAQMREEFVRRAVSGQESKSALCREYGISRRTGDKWLARFAAGEPLEDRGRRPFRTPNKISDETEQLIIACRNEYPMLGAQKIRRILEDRGYTDLPCAKSVNNILKRNGLITHEASRAATPYRRFEKSAPNEMWQADYKGNFALGDGSRCHPLNIIDDRTRFNLCCKAQATETFEEAKEQFIRVFFEYGLPFSLLCDNGNPWGASQSSGFTHFDVWLMELGVLVLHGHPLHPQTQGKEERFNRTLTRELLNGRTFADMAEADSAFQAYRAFYNNERPHCALDLEVPAARYVRSPREYTETVEAWEYPAGYELRKVRENGYISVHGHGYFFSEAFGGKEIAVRESRVPGRFNLYFRQFTVGQIDLDRRVFTFKKPYLTEGDPRLGDR